MERVAWRINKTKGLLLLLVLAVFVLMLYQRSFSQPESAPESGQQAGRGGGGAGPRVVADDGLNGAMVAQTEQRLVDKVRAQYLVPPPPPDVPLNLSKPDLFDTSMGQAQVVRRILKYQRNGFFIECGALDGETRSNTLYLERYLGWTGLLVEGDPSNFALMVKKKRQAWLSPACFSLKSYPLIVSFKQNFNQGQVSNYPAGHSEAGYADVQCFPLFTFLLALNRTTVDYLSLDVEGGELDVLRTVPWDRVDIKVLSVEFIHGPQGKDALREYMENLGYRVVDTVTHSNNLANDFIFVKNTVPVTPVVHSNDLSNDLTSA